MAGASTVARAAGWALAGRVSAYPGARDSRHSRYSVRTALAIALVALTAASLPGSARANEPSDRALFGAGLAMALPTYAIGVSVHEGSHALAAKMVGATVTDVNLLPHVYRGKFYFGRVMVVGLRTRAQRTFFLMAPKLTDSILLGGYSLALGLDALPDNRYGLLALTVLATGFWVDFTRDVFAFWDHNDTVKVYNSYGLDNEWKRLPARLVHAGISVAAAFVIAEGYRRVFEGNEASAATPAALAAPSTFVAPLWQMGF